MFCVCSPAFLYLFLIVVPKKGTLLMNSSPILDKPPLVTAAVGKSIPSSLAFLAASRLKFLPVKPLAFIASLL